MRDTQPIPRCPQCNTRVHRTHTCRVSGLVGLSLPESTPQPSAPPLQLVPMPEGWKSQALERGEWDPTWPTLAQLHLVEEPDLAWPDDVEEVEL